MFPNWNRALIAVSASFHSVAILCTFFRLGYQCHTARLWWDDAWATLALLADIACLLVTALERSIPDDARVFETGEWIFSLAYPILMWAARLSILTSIVRVSRPEGIRRCIALGIGFLFGLVGLALLALRLSLCIAHACLLTRLVLIFQISWCLILAVTADCIADVLLSTLPIWFLRGMKLGRKCRILISSAFSATMVINIVTVVEAVVLLRSALTSGTMFFGHIKVACALIVCNLLVIVAFFYRALHKGDMDTENATSTKVEFTTVDLGQVELDEETSREWLSSSAMTKSSSWSFHGSQSKISRSMTVRIDMERVEECISI